MEAQKLKRIIAISNTFLYLKIRKNKNPENLRKNGEQSDWNKRAGLSDILFPLKTMGISFCNLVLNSGTISNCDKLYLS